MARTVDEVMNRELFAVREGEPPELTRQTILALGITAVPVLDDTMRPIGVVSLRDLFGGDKRARVTKPAFVIERDATVERAAAVMAELDVHHLVAVDQSGRAVGMVSCIDLLRAMIGVPARHPATFPHFDPQHHVEWTDDTPLEPARIGIAPAGPGVLVLLHGALGVPETIVWVEACDNVHGRLEELVVASRPPAFASYERSQLRFRAAAVASPERRRAIVESLRGELEPPTVRYGASR